MSKVEDTKKITVWIQARWVEGGHYEEVDTGVPLDRWVIMDEEEREEVCDDVAKEVFLNMVEYGFYEQDND